MNDKVLVFLTFPALDCRCELLLPCDVLLRDAIPVILKTVTQLTEMAFCCKNILLYKVDENELCDDNKTVIENGIENGTKLMIF